MKKTPVLEHLRLTKEKPLPEAFLALDILPVELLPFSGYDVDRYESLNIEIPWNKYTHSRGDKEVNSGSRRPVGVTIKLVATTDHPTKPTKILLHLATNHMEMVPDYTTFVATAEYQLPIRLQANEIFVRFNQDTFQFARTVKASHTWVELPASGIARRVRVRFDGPTNNDEKQQGLKVQVMIPYKVRVLVDSFEINVSETVDKRQSEVATKRKRPTKISSKQ